MPKLITQSFAKFPNSYVAIERSRALSLLEEKLLYLTINSMQKRYQSTKKLSQIDYEYIAADSISFDDFCTCMEIGAKDHKIIYDSLKNLFSFSLAIDEIETTTFVHLFSEFKIHKQTKTIFYKFSDNFIHYFTGICREYFELAIEEVISLNSSYAIRIYQILKSKLNMDNKDHEYKLDEFKQLLNLGNKYSRYNDLKRFVLDIAKEQINSSPACKFSIDYKEIKFGKAVTSINLIILPKEQNYYQKNNKIAGYKITQLRDHIKAWSTHKNSMVKLAADKINHELKNKNPSRAAIGAYLDMIISVTNQDNLNI